VIYEKRIVLELNPKHNQFTNHNPYTAKIRKTLSFCKGTKWYLDDKPIVNASQMCFFYN